MRSKILITKHPPTTHSIKYPVTNTDKDAAKTDEKSAVEKKLEDKVAELEAALESANKNVEGMKCQSESLAKEYDRYSYLRTYYFSPKKYDQSR